jgi:hypothetical protein
MLRQRSFGRSTIDMPRSSPTSTTRKIALLNDYAENYASMTGEQAENYIRKRAEVEQSIMQLRLKYVPAFRKVLSGRETALFYQLDWRLGLAIDVELVQVPLINP